MTDSGKIEFPPIAKAAKVSGIVILIASFSPAGAVTNLQVISGPPMLRLSALDYAKSWKANASTGERNCPIVIDSRLIGQERECTGKEKHPEITEPPVQRLDPQHVRVTYNRGETCFTTCY